MKIICLQEKISQIINITEKIIGRSLSLPVLNNLLIKAEKNFLKISATDLELGISAWIPVKVEEEGEVCIPAKILSEYISRLPNKKIELESKDYNLFIKCEGYKANIKGLNPEEYPLIPQIKEKDYLEIEAGKLSDSLSRVIETASTSETQVEISGIFINFSKNSVKFVATDSFRLTEKTIPFSRKTEQSFSVILPKKTAQEVIRIFQGINQNLKIFLNPNQIWFDFSPKEMQSPKIQLVSRLIEGKYPDYEQIIPQKFETQLILDKEEFSRQIKMASLFSPKLNEIKLKIDPSKKIIEILSQDPDLGENKSQIKTEGSGKKIEINFNWRYLLDGLNNIFSSEVIFNLNQEEGPTILKPVGDTSYIYIVMPIKSS